MRSKQSNLGKFLTSQKMPQKVVSEVGEVGKIVLWHSEQFLTSFEAFFKGKWLFRGQNAEIGSKLQFLKPIQKVVFEVGEAGKLVFMAF